MHKRNSFMNTLMRWFGILQLSSHLMRSFVRLIEAEAHQAQRKIIVIIVALVFFLMLLLSTWLCLSAMIFTYLVSLNMSYMLSFFILFILNLLLLIITGLIILNSKHDLFFPQTRRLLFHHKRGQV